MLFEKGFEDLGHPQHRMAFPDTEDTTGSALGSRCVSLCAPISLSRESQSVPPCEAAGALGGTGSQCAAKYSPACTE